MVIESITMLKIAPGDFFEPEVLIVASRNVRQIKKPLWEAEGLFYLYGAPGRIRTSDRLVRSQVLYPAELQARCLEGVNYGEKSASRQWHFEFIL